MGDILFYKDDYIFSYRVAGILLHDGKVLLQKPTNGTGFAVPGGHVEFGETNAETLMWEFKEEIGADVIIGDLKWVAEIFFSWDDKPCHQICLYYDVTLKDKTQILHDKLFFGDENIEGRDFKIEFHWMSIDSLEKIEVYPNNIAELMKLYNEGVQHFVCREGS